MGLSVDQALVDLVKKSFGGEIWHATSILDHMPAKSDMLGQMCTIAYSIAALMLIIQLVMMVINISKSGGNIWENLGPVIFRTLILTALISIPLYTLLFRTTITGLTTGISDVISADYIKNFVATWQKMFDGSSLAQRSVFGILTSTGSSLITSIISTIVFIVALVCIFVITQLQPFLWLFAYYIGPICLAFGFCDLTAHVAKNWMNLFLQINFVGVFGSIAFLVANAAGLADHLSVGADATNVILVAVYGVLSIIFFCMIYPLTAYLFGGGIPNSAATSPGTAIAAGGVAMGAYGGAMAAAGGFVQKMGKDGGRMASIGKGMADHGNSMAGAGSVIHSLAQGRLPQEKKGGSSGKTQGSEQRESSIKSNQKASAQPAGGTQGGGGMQGSEPSKPSV